MSLISNCGHDENGKYSGGKAGDQTGTEWALIPWYSRPWNCVLRHPDATVRAKLADLAVKAAKNDKTGYCQTHRNSYWEQLQKCNFDPAKITVACEADCSSGVIAHVKAIGHLFGNFKLKNCSATYTGNLRSGLQAAGFQVLTESKYLNSPDYLLPGDILLKDGSHVATNVATGSKATGSASVYKPSTGSIANKKSNVTLGQEWFNCNYGNVLLQNCGAKLTVDGSYGPSCRKAALAVWKYLVNKKYGTNLDTKNTNFGSTCKSVAGKAVVKSGSSGTFTYLVQFILAGKGLYTGAMDASCGSGTVAGIKAFQKSKGLSADGSCGPNTWYALFN